VLRRPAADDDETRTALLRGIGPRWSDADLGALA
jgi:hypothetical protein